MELNYVWKQQGLTYQQVWQVDAGADEGGGGAVFVLLVAAEDDLVQVRNDLEWLARDEQHRDGDLKPSKIFF